MLPAKPEASAQRDPYSNQVQVDPGTYWRYVGDKDTFLGREIPEDGLVLMIEEARMVDGELHTVILDYHPLWGRGSCKFLIDDFMVKFTPEPDGAAIREAELGRVMDDINAITGRLNSEPPEEELLPLIEAEREKRAKAEQKASEDEDAPKMIGHNSGEKVPAVLLPSQDVSAAQEKLENQLVEMNARKNWIEAQTNEMKSLMETVGRFQMEKANQSLAEISDVTKKSENLLKQVQTMRLFLGEDIHLVQLVEGNSAPKEEPLTFLQQMLYLDEEIFIQAVRDQGGFDHTNMDDLGDILQANPGLVERMMPYERCAVITRVRRKEKQLPDTDAKVTMAQVLQAIADKVENERIQVLIRDGGNVWMVIADETTSNAKRLFPSRQEIDGIFKGRFGGNREITPDDLDYTDARARHDATALFYKRFLIMFWGLHEREGAFGPFMPAAENWLSEEVHSRHFRFIHDEEDVLTDGKPNVMSFMKDKNAEIGVGSRVAVRWGAAVNPDSAPGMYAGHNGGYDPYPIAEEEHPVGIDVCQLKDGQLVVKCPGRRHRGIGAAKKITNFTVQLTNLRIATRKEGEEVREYLDYWEPESVMCLDDVTVEDLDYYIESRRSREHYNAYLQMFIEARKLLVAEREQLAQVLDDLERSTGQPRTLVERAVRIWRASKKWSMPEKSSQLGVIRRIIMALGGGIDLPEDEEILKIEVTGNSDLLITRDVAPDTFPHFEGVDVPYISESHHPVSAKGKIGEAKSTEYTTAGKFFPPASWTLSMPAEEELNRKIKAGRRIIYGRLRGQDQLEAMKALADEDHGRVLGNFLSMLQAPTEDFLEMMLKEMSRMTRDAPGRYVEEYVYTAPLAIAAVRKHRRDFESHLVVASVNLIKLAYQNGYRSMAEKWLCRHYARPSTHLEYLRNYKSTPMSLALKSKKHLPKLMETGPCLLEQSRSLRAPETEGLDKNDFRMWLAEEFHPNGYSFRRNEEELERIRQGKREMAESVKMIASDNGRKAIDYLIQKQISS